jgi:hypothetical protein
MDSGGVEILIMGSSMSVGGIGIVIMGRSRQQLLFIGV